MSAVSPVKLVRLLPDDPRHVAELRRQRVLCGWGGEHVDQWLKEVRQGDKNLYWIFPTDPSTVTFPEEERMYLSQKPGPPPPDINFRPLGHISLDFTDYLGDESLANREEHRVTFATFFILLSQQGKKYGTLVCDELERLAASPEVGAKVMTLNSIPAKSAQDPAFWEKLGAKYDPKARINEHWYEKRGFKPYKVMPRYHERDKDGNMIILDAVFMRKELTPVNP